MPFSSESEKIPSSCEDAKKSHYRAACLSLDVKILACMPCNESLSLTKKKKKEICVFSHIHNHVTFLYATFCNQEGYLSQKDLQDKKIKYALRAFIHQTATLLKVWLSQRSLTLRVRILPLSPSTSVHARVNSASDNFLPSDCEDNQTMLHLMLVHFCISLACVTHSFKLCAARHGVYK